jgi:hypothetical protein
MIQQLHFKLSTLLIILAASFSVNAQVGIGISSPDPSAILHINSTSKGMLTPRMTAAQRLGIEAPAKGMIVFQTDGHSGFYFNTGTPQVPDWAMLVTDKELGQLSASSITSGIISAERLGAGSANDSSFLRGDGIWAVPLRTPSGAAGGSLSGSYPNPIIAANAITTDKIADNTITGADIANATIGIGKLNVTGTASSSNFLRGDGSWSAPSVSGSAGGDLSGTYPNPTIASSAVTSAKIADGTIVNADISASAAIAYSKLSLGSSITSADIVDGTIANADISGSAAIAYSKLNLGSSITSSDIVDGTIANADISSSAAIAYSKLNLGSSITSSDIVDGTIAAGDIANGAITSAKILDATITGADIANTTIGVGKISATGTASSSTFLRGDGAWAAPTVSSVQLRYIICVEGYFPSGSITESFLGEVKLFAGGVNNIPQNYLECKGQSLSTSNYQALFSIIGYTYGGSGNNFNLPNLTSVTAVGR